MPSEHTEPLFKSDDEAMMHWSAHANAAWVAYLRGGDDGDLRDAVNAAANYRSAVERMSHAD